MKNKLLLASLLALGFGQSVFALKFNLVNDTDYQLTSSIFFDKGRKKDLPVEPNKFASIHVPAKWIITKIIYNISKPNDVKESWIISNFYNTKDLGSTLAVYIKDDGAYEAVKWLKSNSYKKNIKNGQAKSYSEDV